MTISALNEDIEEAYGFYQKQDAPLSFWTPLPLSGMSTIERAQKELSIEAPVKKNMLLPLFDTEMEMEKLTNDASKLFEKDLLENQSGLDERFKEREALLQKEAEVTKSRATWGALSAVSQYISSTSSIVLGLSLGGAAGACLIGAGVIGMGTRAAHDARFLETAVQWITQSQELQEKITKQVELGAFVLQLGLTIGGGFWAWRAGAFAASHIPGGVIKEKLASILNGASMATSMTAQLGIRYYEKKAAHMHARLRDIDTEITLHYQTIYQDSGDMRKGASSVQEQVDLLSEAISSLYVPMD